MEVIEVLLFWKFSKTTKFKYQANFFRFQNLKDFLGSSHAEFLLWGFREGRSSYSKQTYFLFRLRSLSFFFLLSPLFQVGKKGIKMKLPSSSESGIHSMPCSLILNTVMFLSFRTDRSEQTVQTQIKLLLQGLHCLQFPLLLLDPLL